MEASLLVAGSVVDSLASLGMYLFYPAQVIYTQVIMSEILLQTWLLLSLLFLTLLLSGKGNRYLLFVNLCLSLAALTKGVFVYCWIPNMAFHFWLFLRTHRKTVLLLSLIPLLTVSCWSYRNYKRTGVFHFSSISQKQQGYLVKRYWKRERAAFARENPGQLRQGDDYTTAKRGVEYSFLKVVARNWQDYTLYHMRGVLFFFLRSRAF